MAGKFELFQDKASGFRFRLKAANGETILASEGYTEKSSAREGIASVRLNSSDDDHYERKEASDGQHMFNLKAANGQVIGTSEMYTSTSARDNGIASVKLNASDAEEVDLT
ncbi:MAG: YegP family protein [Alphaproteobacteria bacterium]|nr:YegP family protein [Alphaproteobacteria bacterium]